MAFLRNEAKLESISRPPRNILMGQDEEGEELKVTDYFGENVFDFRKSSLIPDDVKKAINEVSVSREKRLKKEHAEIVAKAVLSWATNRGATHFCHWFQPLTGKTAEKHDSFLDFKAGKPIMKLSASQLMQGEPDASSFPNGGSRSTFEARGYTSWDLTSPMFLLEGENGKVLCIPTAFISYNGDALDIKTPLLRSISRLSDVGTRFLNLIGDKKVKSVQSTCGCEQEYFLIDKSFYYLRPDLVMSSRTLLGGLTSRNQQLSDHYFGTVPERVLSFMQELDFELHRLGVPAKTRHNEVAPGQFELAPIFMDANVAVDHNQLIMATIKKTAEKHDFVALLHEKPFAGINGSGKHLNWSMATDGGENLLEPGKNPEKNHRFLAMAAIVVDAAHKHAKALRMSIAGHGNDHRLGANEAPPSIISVFLGDTLNKIFDSFVSGSEFKSNDQNILDVGTKQLADLLKDNTDRNRTSPLAFTGNKFEFRAVGSSQAAGFPLTILNAAIADVMEEACTFIEDQGKKGVTGEKALIELIRHFIGRSKNVIFTGDGYSHEWVEEAKRRGLPNLKTTPEALSVLNDSKEMAFLTKSGIFRESEITTRYNVAFENYNLLREIEFRTLISMVYQNVLPSVLEYKNKLSTVIRNQKEVGLDSSVEIDQYKNINILTENIYDSTKEFERNLNDLKGSQEEIGHKLSMELLPMSVKIAECSNKLEDVMPVDLWSLPTYYDMLFLR